MGFALALASTLLLVVVNMTSRSMLSTFQDSVDSLQMQVQRPHGAQPAARSSAAAAAAAAARCDLNELTVEGGGGGASERTFAPSIDALRAPAAHAERVFY
eukprot:COSAG01_NODE_4353_length_5111_cov_52.320830_1_plen_101_part_00